MRLICFLFLVFVTTQAYAQTRDKATVEKLLCREWKLEYLMESGRKITPAEGANETMTFREDHTASKSGAPVTATWSFDEAKQVIMFSEDGKAKPYPMEIKELTEEKFVFAVKAQSRTQWSGEVYFTANEE